MDIIEYSGNAAEWDEYVLRSENTTIYHQIGWKQVIEKTFGHKSYYLIAKKGGEIKGILPLFLMKSRIFGSSLVSLPFVDYGGVIAENKEIAKKLIDTAIEIAEENKVDYLELRQFTEMNDSRLASKTYKVSFILPLDPDPQVIWKRMLQKNKRKKVRKATKYLTVRFGQDDKDLIKCYKVFSKAMRDLGAPVYPVELFMNICDVFPNQTKILMATYKGEVVGAKIMFSFKNTMFWRFQYSVRRFFGLASNELLYWTAIKYACENGYKFIDLGRSTRDSGSFHFKRQFGAREQQLYYQYYLNGMNEFSYVSPSNKKYRLAIAIWKRLPLFITEIVGPRIIKNIP